MTDTDNTALSYKESPTGRCLKENFYLTSHSRHSQSSTASMGLHHEPKKRRVISEILVGVEY